MQYLVIAHDGRDELALERRLAARPAHLALGDKLRASGHMLYGVSVLNDQEKMVGSVLICDFADRKELDAWLQIEPYVTGKVWDRIEIKRCKVGPSFAPK